MTAVAILAAAAGAWLGFANPFFHVPLLALLFPMGVAAAALKADSPGRAFKYAWLAGFLGYGLAMYWVAIPVHDFGGLPWILAAPCPALLALYMGLYPGLFGLFIFLGRGMNMPAYGLMAASLWAALELARGTLFTGFPWVVLASAFTPWIEAIQAASIMGAYALSGVFAGIAVLLSVATPNWKSKFTALALIAVVWGYGAWTLSKPLETRGRISASVVQGNIDQSLKWDESFQAGTVERYIRLSQNEIKHNDPELIIWPETALPFYFQEPSVLSGKVRAFARDFDTALLAGSPAYRPDYDNGGMVLHNRAYLIDSGEVSGRYDKEHLVPFGEYIPLQKVLFFLDKLVAGVGDFKPGKDQKPLEGDGFKAGVLICYETIFPELARMRVQSGANLLVNISNDAWFGRSSAPRQHLHLSALRAVELKRSLARSTNTGISAFIDPRGRITGATQLFRPATLNEPNLALVDEVTFFHENAGVITAAYCIIAALLGGLAAWRYMNGPSRP